MIGTLACALALTVVPATVPQRKIIEEDVAQAKRPVALKTVAILPWSLKDATPTAEKTAVETINALFTGVNYEVIPYARTKAYWEEELSMKKIEVSLQGKNAVLPDIPRPTDLLKLGRLMGVDIVCAGRASWHTRSIWVGLGPKTKATCTVDMIIIDVKAAEIILEAKKVAVDSHKRETTAETAAALLLSMGFTALSGGPKTPHQQKSGRMAISEAMEPWLQTVAPKSRKIKIDGDGGGG